MASGERGWDRSARRSIRTDLTRGRSRSRRQARPPQAPHEYRDGPRCLSRAGGAGYRSLPRGAWSSASQTCCRPSNRCLVMLEQALVTGADGAYICWCGRSRSRARIRVGPEFAHRVKPDPFTMPRIRRDQGDRLGGRAPALSLQGWTLDAKRPAASSKTPRARARVARRALMARSSDRWIPGASTCARPMRRSAAPSPRPSGSSSPPRHLAAACQG